MRAAAVVLLAIIALGGCSKRDAYLPLDVGRTWTYTARNGFVTWVEPVRVESQLSVAGVQGAEVSGPMGSARLAWKEGVLMADRLANARFDPPITLLAPVEPFRSIRWSGRLQAVSSESATALTQQERSSVTIGGRRISTIKATLRVDTPGRQILLESHYAPGIGLVKQEQRTNGNFDLALELLPDP